MPRIRPIRHFINFASDLRVEHVAGSQRMIELVGIVKKCRPKLRANVLRERRRAAGGIDDQRSAVLHERVKLNPIVQIQLDMPRAGEMGDLVIGQADLRPERDRLHL